MEFRDFFQAHPKAAIAVSGGADSAFLLHVAKTYAQDVTAWYVMSPFQTLEDSRDARRLCSELGVKLTIIKANILKQQNVIRNDAMRCYYCKKYMFEQIKEAAYAAGYEEIMEGTNASDCLEDRPGYAALQELGVLSPLRVCGITKAAVRTESERLGLFTAKKSSNSCLATRIPAKMPITFVHLQRVEQCERMLRELGIGDLRVRIEPQKEGIGARIQVPQQYMENILKYRTRILEAFALYFQSIVLDLETREGND